MMMTKRMLSFNFIFFSIGLLLALHQVSALSITKLNVPSEANAGDSVRLTCDYEVTRKEPLYMVKWYHNGEEFYRYVFHEFPKPESVGHPHITLDLSKSDKNSVILTNLSEKASGRYFCEVWTNGALFKKVIANKDLLVVMQNSTQKA